MKTTVMLLIVFLLFSLTTFAQDYTRWGLPDGVKARLGKGTLNEIQYSPGGTLLAVASSIGIWLYDTTTHQEVALLTGHTGRIDSVAFSSDGRTLVGGSSDGTIHLWDAVTGRYIRTLTGHTYLVRSVAFSSDGRTIASGSSDDTIRLWDAVTGEHIHTLTVHTELVGSGVVVREVAFSPDTNTIATVSWGTRVKRAGVVQMALQLWDTNTGRHIRTLTGHTGLVTSVVFSPDGRTMASGSGDGTVRIWNAHTGVLLKTLKKHRSHVRTSYVWTSQTVVKRISEPGVRVNSVSFSPDGRTIASGSSDDTIRLWDAVTGEHIHTLTAHTDRVYSVTFSPDGNTIAGASRDATICLWDALTGENIRTLTGHTGWVNSVSFSPDGRTIASGSWDATIRLWDALTGENIRTLEGYPAPVNSVSFSPDGRTIASGSSDDTIRLWDAVTSRHIRALAGHTGWVNSVSFSPDGRTIASGSSDDTIRLWDAVTGRHIRALAGHTDSVRSVSFSPDGRTIASGSDDGTILLWELAPSVHTNSTVSILTSPVPSPGIGAQLTISLKITDGANVAGYQATVAFDTSALRYVESANGDYLPTGAFFVPPIVSGNKINLAATSLSGESNGDGILATVTFEVIAVKASTLTLSDVILSDSGGTGIQPQVENGEVVEPPQLKEDLNRDGVVNIQDLVLIVGAFGNTAAAPSFHPQALAALTAADVEGWLTGAQALNLTDAQSKRGILFLEELLSALTPKETALLPNYPNPFNPETWMPYHLSHAADVQITIYDTTGAVVRQLDLGYQSAGYYTERSKAAYWDGRNEDGESVASGVYFYQLRAANYSAMRRMVIVK